MPPRRRSVIKERDRGCGAKHEGSGKDIHAGEKLTNYFVADFLKENLSVTLRFKKADCSPTHFFRQAPDCFVLSFPIQQLDTDFFKLADRALFFYTEAHETYVARIKSYTATIRENIVTLYVHLCSVMTKEVWDREFMTEEFFYTEYVMGMNKLWDSTGEKLNDLIKPLGLTRKAYEDDNMLKRRVLSYLQATIHLTNDVTENLKRN